MKTGKRGRPAKEYNTVDSNNRSDGAERNEQFQDDSIKANDSSDDQGNDEATKSSDDDFLGWETAEMAMNACEVSMERALSGSDSEEWEDAIYAEMKSLIANKTFDLMDRPPTGKVIKCRTILPNKYGPDRELNKRKARVVAKGFAQQPGIHFFETFAPVARLSSL